MENQQFITIKESHTTADLLVLKSKLESEGIYCRLKDELSTQVLNHLPAMTVELQVINKDLPQVREIMEAHGERLDDYKAVLCPNCKSDNIKVKSSLRNALRMLSGLFVSVITFSPIGNIFSKAEYKCIECDHEFRAI